MTALALLLAPALSAPLDARVVLVGDPGWGDGPTLGALPEPGRHDCALAEAARVAAEQPALTTVLLLGDNVYGDHEGVYGGFPADAAARPWTRLRCRAEDPACAETFSLEEQQLLAQLDPLSTTGAPAIWVPGNHDYYAGGTWGLRREQVFIEAYADVSGADFSLLPAEGCPGPRRLDVGQHLSLVLVDSAGWLSRRAMPPYRNPVNADCPAWDADRFDGLLAATLTQVKRDDRQAVLVSHHPFTTYGKHGRLGGLTAFWGQQEQRSSSLQRLQRRVCEATGADPAACRAREVSAPSPHLLAHVAGHEHGLQVLPPDASGFRHQLVSGAGTLTQAGRGQLRDPGPEAARLISNSAGFMVLELDADGASSVEVVQVSPSCEVSRQRLPLEPAPR